MLYFPSFYCLSPNHNGEIVRFDAENHKPVSGSCGHSICLQCHKNDPHMKCPICAQKDSFFTQLPNYQAMEMTVTCRDRFLEVLRVWWRGEKFGIGACSICSSHSLSLLLCLDCHSDLYHGDQESPGYILDVRNFPDLMKLSRNVLCSDCALSEHQDIGHRIEKLEDFNFDKRNIKTITAKEILVLFKEEIEQKRSKVDCKLRKMRLAYVENRISELLDRKIDQEDPNLLRESIRHALVGLHIEHLIMKTNDLIDEFRETCECSRIYKKLTANAENSEELDQIYGFMAYYRIERFSLGCPFYFKSRDHDRLWLYQTAEEKPQKIRTDSVPKSPCSLCVSLNGNEETRVQKILEDYVRDYKNNASVDLTLPHSMCLRCLNILDRNFE